MPSLRQRVLDAAGVDDAWERPRPEIGRQDVVLAATIGILGLLSLELVRSSGGLDRTDAPVWAQWLVALSGALLLLGRRRWPLVVAILAAGHMFVAGVAMPQVMGQLASQIVYFVAILSGVAWARDRKAMLLVVGSIIGFMFAWLCWQFVVGSAVQDWYDDLERTREGVFAPIPAAIGLTMLINGVYFGGAVVGGGVSWRSARQRDRLQVQASTIARQAGRLREQAVMDERLRIARELHDVVAHHVSAMGIQAGAARRVLDRDADAARTALTHVEEASRDAVTQMRRLLGTLREGEVRRDDGASRPRTTEAGIDDLPDLLAEGSGDRLSVSLDVVETPSGAAARLPRGIGLAVYRTVQEALTNVRRHSSADTVSVVIRVDEKRAAPYAEVEVVDNGRPRVGTSGSGLGQLGIRERAATHDGQVEIGPRVAGGYRVRVRYPLELAPGSAQ